MENPKLTEPAPVADVFVTGAAVESSKHVIRIVGWVELPFLSGEVEERRIIVRFVLPVDAAGRLVDELNRHLRRDE